MRRRKDYKRPKPKPDGYYNLNRANMQFSGHTQLNNHYLRLVTLSEAVVLSWLEGIGWNQEGKDRIREIDGRVWFYCTTEFLCDRLNMTKAEQRASLESLELRGFIERRMIGNPAKRWIWINYDAIEETNMKDERPTMLRRYRVKG